MKIRPVTAENCAKVEGLLQRAFSGGKREIALVEALRLHNKMSHEWVCLHVNTVIAYIAFTGAYDGEKVCGLHVSFLAVKPEFQGQGVATELLRFALRQASIREQTLFVLGPVSFFSKFNFIPCSTPTCPFTRKNSQFLSLRNSAIHSFEVGYEPEFFRGEFLAAKKR